MAPAGGHCGEGSSPGAEPFGEAAAPLETSDAGGRQPLWIESLALPDEEPGELRALLAQWTEVYEPASVIEGYLLEMIVSDLIRLRRCRRWQEALEQRLGPRAALDDPGRAGIVSARRHYAKMFHANYGLLLEFRKRPQPPAAVLETSFAAALGPREGQRHLV
jgi:hypothetical protein